VYNDVDVVAYLRAARTHVVEASRDAEVIFPPYVSKIEENAQQFGSPYDPRDKQGADEQAIGALHRMASEKNGSVLFFAGCTTRLFQPEIAVAALRILDALGVDYLFAPDREPCCGGPVADLGFTELGREEEATRDYINASGCSLRSQVLVVLSGRKLTSSCDFGGQGDAM
jgi:Fe-S oxidoreductase